jgi:hypothetical protein
LTTLKPIEVLKLKSPKNREMNKTWLLVGLCVPLTILNILLKSDPIRLFREYFNVSIMSYFLYWLQITTGILYQKFEKIIKIIAKLTNKKRKANIKTPEALFKLYRTICGCQKVYTLPSQDTSVIDKVWVLS